MFIRNHISLSRIISTFPIFLILINCQEDKNIDKFKDKLIWSETFENNNLQGWQVFDEVSDEESNWFIE